MLGYKGQLFGALEIREFQEQTRAHEALCYNADGATGAWRKSALAAGQKLRQPKPLSPGWSRRSSTATGFPRRRTRGTRDQLSAASMRARVSFTTGVCAGRICGLSSAAVAR